MQYTGENRQGIVCPSKTVITFYICMCVLYYLLFLLLFLLLYIGYKIGLLGHWNNGVENVGLSIVTVLTASRCKVNLTFTYYFSGNSGNWRYRTFREPLSRIQQTLNRSFFLTHSKVSMIRPEVLADLIKFYLHLDD